MISFYYSKLAPHIDKCICYIMNGSNAIPPHFKARYTLLDVWNAAKYEKNFNFAFWMHITLDIIVEQAIRTGGYCLICCAVALIVTISVFGFFVVVPAIASPWSLWFVFNIIWGLFMLFSISFNYFMAVVTKPGQPSIEPSLAGLRSRCSDSMNSNVRQCKKCNEIKPARTHHCSVCKSCVLKMDHHCPWLGNCVGYRNYRYFVCFLIWVTITTSYVAAICAPKVFSGGSVLFPNDDFSLSNTVKKTLGMQPLLDVLGRVVTARTTKEQLELLKYEGVRQKTEGLTGVDRPTGGAATVGEEKAFFTTRYRRQLLNADSENSSVVNQNGSSLTLPSNILTTSTSADSFLFPIFQQLPILSSLVAPPHPMNRSLQTAQHLDTQQQHQQQHGSSRVSKTSWHKIVHWRETLQLPEEGWVLFFCLMICSGVAFGTGTLMFFHIYLISRGQTTIEYFEGQMVAAKLSKEGRMYVNPYDRGSFLKNLEQVFGEVPWYVMILPSLRPPPPYSYFLRSNLDITSTDSQIYPIECRNSGGYVSDGRSVVDMTSRIRDREEFMGVGREQDEMV